MKGLHNTIYVITNVVNNKKYIGQTWKTIQKRWRQHYSPHEKSCLKLNRAISKYGKESFIIEELAQTSSQEVADYLEISYISEYNTCSIGYNIRLGRSRGKHSEVSKKKMSVSQMGNKNNLGHKDSEEVRLIKSIAAKKRPFTNRRTNGPLSEDTKKKLSVVNKGRTWKLVDGKRVWMDK